VNVSNKLGRVRRFSLQIDKEKKVHLHRVGWWYLMHVGVHLHRVPWCTLAISYRLTRAIKHSATQIKAMHI
jgi:hypothetical protein